MIEQRDIFVISDPDTGLTTATRFEWVRVVGGLHGQEFIRWDIRAIIAVCLPLPDGSMFVRAFGLISWFDPTRND